jgi:hypothetical protein
MSSVYQEGRVDVLCNFVLIGWRLTWFDNVRVNDADPRTGSFGLNVGRSCLNVTTSDLFLLI